MRITAHVKLIGGLDLVTSCFGQVSGGWTYLALLLLRVKCHFRLSVARLWSRVKRHLRLPLVGLVTSPRTLLWSLWSHSRRQVVV